MNLTAFQFVRELWETELKLIGAAVRACVACDVFVVPVSQLVDVIREPTLRNQRKPDLAQSRAAQAQKAFHWLVPLFSLPHSSILLKTLCCDLKSMNGIFPSDFAAGTLVDASSSNYATVTYLRQGIKHSVHVLRFYLQVPIGPLLILYPSPTKG